MTLYLILILLLPLGGALVNALFGRYLPRRGVEIIGCGVIWGAAIVSALAFAGYSSPYRVELASWLADFDFKAPITLYLDPLSLVLTVMITWVCALIHTYSVGYMKDEDGYARYFALLNLFVFAMLLLILAENLPLLYVGWEGVGFCSYFLISFWYDKPANATAGRKAFIVTRIGDTGLAIGIIWLFQLCGTVSIFQLNGMGFLLPPGIVTAIGLLFLVGAMGKSAQVPLMVWLPDAMAGPTPVSAQIHAATMVTAGVYLLARMFPLIGMSATVTAAIAVTGAATAFYGATVALAQRDLKKVLAFSTISQIGYMVLGVGAGAISAATFHLLVHAFFKALLFLGAGCVITAMHHEQDIFRMGGLRKQIPGTFWCFLAGALCLAGIPGTGGFFSKDAILLTVWEKGGPLYQGLYLLALVTAFLTAIYSFRLVYLVFGGGEEAAPISVSTSTRTTPSPSMGEGGGEGEKRHVSAVPPVMTAALIPLAILGLGGGLLDLPAYLGGGWLTRFLTGHSAHAADMRLELALQATAGAVALAGLAVAHLLYSGKRREEVAAKAAAPSPVRDFFLNGWYADALYRLLFIRPFDYLSGIFWRIVDEKIIDRSLDRLASLFGSTGDGISRWTTGNVTVYLLSIAGGLGAIVVYVAWRMM